MKMPCSLTTFLGVLVVVSQTAGIGVADTTPQGAVPAQSKKTGIMVNLPIIPSLSIPARFLITGLPETTAPGLGRQPDSWSSGPHALARLALFHGQQRTFPEVVKERLALGIPGLEQVANSNSKATRMLKSVVDAVGKEALVKQIGTSGTEEVTLLKRTFDTALLKELATLDDLKQLLAQGKPVAVLLTRGGHEDPTINRVLDKKIKLNDYQWVVVFGYNDADQVFHYADPGLEQHQTITYETMGQRWETTERGFFLDLDEGFLIRPRTMVWIDKKK
ncbi:MAG: hypothetical protein HQL74_12870 [Magnetococcales bacterium]|nr:hypothetical protein [Magnetococcales bacterium]